MVNVNFNSSHPDPVWFADTSAKAVPSSNFSNILTAASDQKFILIVLFVDKSIAVPNSKNRPSETAPLFVIEATKDATSLDPPGAGFSTTS